MNSAFDVTFRLDFVTDWAGRVTDFQYDGNSRLWKIILPNGTQRIFGYDAAGRVNLIRDEVTATGATISQFGFEYDLMNRITREIVTPEPTPYTVPVATMTYDDDDRMETWNGQACASDADGNLTSGPLGGSLAAFGYDARNRLTGAGGITYTYDAENRRTIQTAAGVTTTYVHDPQGALSRMLVRTKGTEMTRYVYAGNQLLYGETEAGALEIHHFDYRGSTVAITDGVANVTDRATYGPYGEIVARTGTTDTPFLFNGAYGVMTDANPAGGGTGGLLYMRARYYNPETHRFLNADPIGFAAGNNWYGFVAGDPVTGIDPMGLDVIYLLDQDAVPIGRYMDFFTRGTKMRPGAGHGALLIGDDQRGYTYISYGPGPDQSNGVFDTRKRDDNLDVKQFRGKDLRTVLNDLSHLSESNPMGLAHGSDYDHYLFYDTTTEQDRAAYGAAMDALGSTYWITGWNCDDVVAEALKAAKVKFNEAWRPVESYDNNTSNADRYGQIK